MEQIKNYLSGMECLNKVLILGKTQEMEELKHWILTNKKANELTDIEELNNKNIHADAVIFDYDTSHLFSDGEKISCDLLLGRMKHEENCFGFWEKHREKTKTIYIDKNKGLRKEEITADRRNSEILFWEKGKEDIELSIIIPVYNVEKYLSTCIESLISWKAPYVEFLFVNDGSTDDSANIILNYEKKDHRIRLITKENGGCASARNRGMKEAKGRYIGFVDSDDFVEQDMFQKLLSRALIGGYDLAYCGYKEYEEETGRSVPVMNDCLDSFYSEGTWRQDKVQLLAIKTRVAIWRCIYKKEFLDKHHLRFYEELKRFDDLPFRVEVMFTAKSAVCVPEYLYDYRVGRIGQDISCTDERLYVHFTIFDYLDRFVDQLHDQRLKDLLQIIKIHTHGYGLSRIEKKYKKEYRNLAIKQLDRNMGYLRTICLILMYTGKRHVGWYTWGKTRDVL